MLSIGAGNRVRTGDIQLRKLTLYQLRKSGIDAEFLRSDSVDARHLATPS